MQRRSRRPDPGLAASRSTGLPGDDARQWRPGPLVARDRPARVRFRPSAFYEAARDALGAEEEVQTEELFGPAEGLHSTYRMLRDEVLEASWRAGSALSEMRLDTAEDVTQAVARYLELIKLAALVQRPGAEPAAEALEALNELLGRAASPEQRAALEASTLDEYVLGEERDWRPGASWSPRGGSRRWSRSSLVAETAWRCRPRTSTSTGPAR